MLEGAQAYPRQPIACGGRPPAFTVVVVTLPSLGDDSGAAGIGGAALVT